MQCCTCALPDAAHVQCMHALPNAATIQCNARIRMGAAGCSGRAGGACLRNVAIPDLLEAKVLLVVLYRLVHVTCISKKESGELLYRSRNNAKDLLIRLSCCFRLGSAKACLVWGLPVNTSTARDTAATVICEVCRRGHKIYPSGRQHTYRRGTQHEACGGHPAWSTQRHRATAEHITITSGDHEGS